jgi:hypothetical protein
VTLAAVLSAIDEAEQRLIALRASADLPDEPDRAWADAWLHRSYLAYWSGSNAG